MLSARDELRHLADCLTEDEAERLVEKATEMGLNAPCWCPYCAETTFDRLSWTDDDCIECLKCGTTFDPNGPGKLTR